MSLEFDEFRRPLFQEIKPFVTTERKKKLLVQAKEIEDLEK